VGFSSNKIVCVLTAGSTKAGAIFCKPDPLGFGAAEDNRLYAAGVLGQGLAALSSNYRVVFIPDWLSSESTLAQARAL
jgi:hypothetical protein